RSRGSLRYSSPSSIRSPAAALALVLLFEPALERREVLEDRARVHLPRAGQRLERVGPRLARAEREHRPQALAGLLRAIEVARVQRALVARRLAHRSIELELQHLREEIAHVRGVPGNVVLGARIEVLLGARRRRRDALVFQAQRPPGLVVIGRLGLAG